MDDLVRAESILCEDVASPVFGSTECGPGQVKHPHPLASRITDAVANLRTNPNIRTWKGPLPRPRIAPVRQLGGFHIRDLRMSSPGLIKQTLSDFCAKTTPLCQTNSEVSSVVSRWKTGPNVLSGFDGPKVARVDQEIPIGYHLAFHPTPGLNSLFNAGGQPRGCRLGFWTNFQAVESQ